MLFGQIKGILVWGRGLIWRLCQKRDEGNIHVWWDRAQATEQLRRKPDPSVGSEPNEASLCAVPHLLKLGVGGVRAVAEGGNHCLKSSYRPQGDGRVLEVRWPESSLSLRRLQMSRRRDAFRRVAWLPHLGQGAKFTHQEFLPFFNLFLILLVRG